MRQRLLNVREAACYLGIKKSTLYTWAEQKKVPALKIGRRLLFDLKELDLWIEAQKDRALDAVRE